MNRPTKVLFHSPCFDGIASAVLTADFLQQHEGWTGIDFMHVNYDVRSTWLDTHLDGHTAVVDFLYHPDAAFWADHHGSTFLNEAVRHEYDARSHDCFIYDRSADSCAGLLWRHFQEQAGYRNEVFADLVRWAEKVDAARYQSVDEALSFTSPALKVSASLALSSDGYSEFLVRMLITHSLEEVSAMPEVHARFEEFERLTGEGLARMRTAAQLRDEIVVFDVDARGAMVPRYSPYRFFPQARYSVGVSRFSQGAKVTAMRNPWIEFDSIPLGDIFTRYGGGGHQRVASAYVPEHIDPRERLEEIVAAVTAADRSASATR
jgi:hypothetical protein